MKRKLALVTAALMLCSAVLTGCGPKTPAAGSKSGGTSGGSVSDLPYYEWSLSCEYSAENHQTLALQDAAKLIEEQTGGHIKITVYPNMALGDYTVVYGQVMTGDIEIAACPIAPEYDRRAVALNLPFLATDFTEFADNYFQGGFMWNLIDDITQKNGVKLLGIFNAGFMGLGAKKVDSEDFEFLTGTQTKSMLMRSPSSNAFAVSMKEMGYNTTVIPYADLYSAMQSGLCDGWVGGSGLVNYDSFRDVIKYFVDCNVVNECIPVQMNQELFDSLPAGYQTIVTDVFDQMQNRVNDERQAQEAQALVDMENYGIKVITGTDGQMSALRDRIRAQTWPQLVEDVGQDVIDAACEAYGVQLP